MHLIIAEKNIAAQRIAQILAGNVRPTSGREGGVPTYQFDGHVVVGLRGHVVEVDFEPGYSDWRSTTRTPRSLIDAETRKIATEKRIVGQIQKLAKKADLITIATDFDTEGELIGKEAFDLIRQVNTQVPIQRVKFSAITKTEIFQAFQHPVSLDFNLAAAGETRQVVDLVWGASLTRFISIAAKRGGKNILSVGRVQSPTLAMIVDREKEIEAFEPQTYWMLSLSVARGEEVFEARHTHGRFWDHVEATGALDRTGDPVRVTQRAVGSRTNRPPAPFDTTTFIVAAARLGFSVANAMRIAEELYMNGFISYPRTDNTVYPPSLDLSGLLRMLKRSAFAGEAEYVIAHRRPSPTRGKKSSTDHPPIHPTAPAHAGAIPPDQWKIYELVVRRFLATLSPDARWETLKYTFDAGGEPYMATGARLVEEGYRRVYTYGESRETVLPWMEVGDVVRICEVLLAEKETHPPPRYSQSRLIQQMEELGLGTKSTRHDVIGKLYARRYVEGSPMKPTMVGSAVTESLEGHAALITKPDMTRKLESHMEEIKIGKRTKQDVLSESRQMLHTVFDELELHEGEIGEEIMDRTDAERIIGKCPVCRHDLVIRHTRGAKQFIGCAGYPDCSFNIGLPGMQWGRAVRCEARCDKHGLHHVQLVRKGARPWELGCPLCMHIQSNIDNMRLIPSMTDSLLEELVSHHIYTVYELATMPVETIAANLSLPEEKAELLHEEAKEVLDILRKRSTLRKFIRKTLPPRKGRSLSGLVKALFGAGVNSIHDLSRVETRDLTQMKLGEREAKELVEKARTSANEGRMREMGVPPASLKKYIDAGISSPEEICLLHPACLSDATGISIDTVQRHAAMVCRALGLQAHPRITRRALDTGTEELLEIPGLGKASVEKLHCAGVIDAAGLAGSDPAKLSIATGIAEEKLREFIMHVRGE
ncbi:MAG: DNA topoisomerase I [Methanomicrobiaceae archaeon]|nr:DNA topoisomerase I [Methanomicrobiaceae archaeon]